MQSLEGRITLGEKAKISSAICSSSDLGTLLVAGLQKMSIDSLECSSPRKSLVKGERFMRGIEEKPE